jgi:hypothetical protein
MTPHEESLKKVAELIQEVGYKALVKDGAISSKSSGYSILIFHRANKSLQFYFGITISGTIKFSLERANRFNREANFGKCYINDDYVAFEQDFLFDIESSNAKNELDEIFDIWEFVMGLAQDAIAEEEENNEEIASESSEEDQGL